MISTETYLKQVVPNRMDFGISVNDCFSAPYVVADEGIHELAQTKYGRSDFWIVIAWYNNLRNVDLVKGQKLKLPSRRGALYLFRMLMHSLDAPKRKWWQIF